MRPGPRGARRLTRALGTAVAVALLAVAGCTASGVTQHQATAVDPVAASSAPATPAAPAVRLDVTPASDARGVAPAEPVTVNAHNGRITSATLTTARGRPVRGELSADGSTWSATGALRFGTTYDLSVAAADPAQRSKQLRTTFTTVTPKATTYPSVVPLDGETVGVGIPIIIYWSKPVHDRAAAERALKVTADKPVHGAWHWYSDTEVHFRPRHFWPAYTHVTIHIGVGGKDLGGGVYGETSREIHFTVGSSMISRVSNAKHRMTVSRDGKVVRTMPVALGLSRTPTSSGTMVVFEKYKQKYFDSSTFGVPRDAPGGYYEKVYWDTKYTYGGEYVHAAPWSVVQQGHANASHGCVNVSTANAEWFYYHSKRGDVIQIQGTRRMVRPQDGWTDWNLSWSDWLAGSAVH